MIYITPINHLAFIWLHRWNFYNKHNNNNNSNNQIVIYETDYLNLKDVETILRPPHRD